ncbi:E3 ubiquitin-protein ligase RNF130-like [Chiloscyllium plagiosum]|uniref:E3 ubiquitin-protein ligase RNF130-like n=1 Tax=Chiloscyllium plagiosum TaxID=36176 RepID=UPI001CB7DCE5|nr:E3 ubiquitin-protein ligase RNF130-like [Chiloscyllium plagiosum]
MERATRARPPPPVLPAAYLLLLLLLVFPGRARSQSEPPDHDSVKDELVIAAVKVSYVDRASGQRVLLPDRGEDSRYGRDSPKEGLEGGTVLVPARAPGRARNLQGCEPRTRFAVPPDTRRWIALLSRGNCTFKQKILLAAAQKAAAVVIYHNVSGEKPITMSHEGNSAGGRGAGAALAIASAQVKPRAGPAAEGQGRVQLGSVRDALERRWGISN